MQRDRAAPSTPLWTLLTTSFRKPVQQSPYQSGTKQLSCNKGGFDFSSARAALLLMTLHHHHHPLPLPLPLPLGASHQW